MGSPLFKPMGRSLEFVLRCIFLADFDLKRTLAEIMQRNAYTSEYHRMFDYLISSAPDLQGALRVKLIGRTDEEMAGTSLAEVVVRMLNTHIHHGDSETCWAPWSSSEDSNRGLILKIIEAIDFPAPDAHDPLLLRRHLAREIANYFRTENDGPRSSKFLVSAEEILLRCIFLADFDLKCPVTEVLRRDSGKTGDYAYPIALEEILRALCDRPILAHGNEVAQPTPVSSPACWAENSLADVAAMILEHDGIMMSDNKPVWLRFLECPVSYGLNTPLRELLAKPLASNPLDLIKHLASILANGRLGALWI